MAFHYDGDSFTQATVLDFLKKQHRPMAPKVIARFLKIPKKDKKLFLSLLESLIHDGVLTKKAGKVSFYDLKPKKRPVHWGRYFKKNRVLVLSTPTCLDVALEGSFPDLKIDDILEITLQNLDQTSSNQAIKAQCRRIYPRNHVTKIVGIFSPRQRGTVKTLSRKNSKTFFLTHGGSKAAQNGDIVEAWVMKDHDREKVMIEKRLKSDALKEISPSAMAIMSQEIAVPFSEKSLSEAEALGAFNPQEHQKTHQDLSHLPFVTIDDESAHDFDDAVMATMDDDPANAGGYLLSVAIADVSFYVKTGGALDEEAMERGNSVYFPDRVVPMLPERLSNNLCSLREGEIRPVVVAHVKISRHGKILSQTFQRAFIRSKARLTYTQVQSFLDHAGSLWSHPPIEEAFKPLVGVYHALKKDREVRGALDIDIPEPRIHLDDGGRLTKVDIHPRYDSHRLIEVCMIAANVAVAHFLADHDIPFLHRIHGPPKEDRVQDLRHYLSSFDLSLPPMKDPKPKDFKTILKKIKGHPFEPTLQEFILRAQCQAMYSPDPEGHFGLNLTHYTHFTSPIRRYNDLIIHRLLLQTLESPQEAKAMASSMDLSMLGVHLSQKERAATMAEREAKALFLLRYHQEVPQETWMARIVGCSSAGLFVRMEETWAEALLPMRYLPKDAYIWKPTHQILAGKSHQFHLHQILSVQVQEVNGMTGTFIVKLPGTDPMGDVSKTSYSHRHPPSRQRFQRKPRKRSLKRRK